MLESAIAGVATLAVVVIGLVVRALLAVLVIGALLVPLALLVLGWAWGGRLADRAAGLQRLGHVRWRRGCYYTPGHLWLRPRPAGAVRLGLDDIAHRVLPDIGSVRLPMPGERLDAGDTLGQIHCSSGVVTLRAPVSGIVEKVNERLAERPSLLHADPYRRAWLVEMEPRDDGYRTLPTGEPARRWLAQEDARLTEFFEHQLGIAAADGGELIVPPHTLLTPEQWQAARSAFIESEATTAGERVPSGSPPGR
jgi:glycine cleavage system H protein